MSGRRPQAGLAGLIALPCLLLGLAAGAAAKDTATASATTTFGFTGGEQVFKVPDGVTSITVSAVGGQGGAGDGLGSAPPALGGEGAVATGTVAVSPGQNLFINVGGNGTSGDSPGLPVGGFNGGGNGGSDGDGSVDAGGGGGATDIRTITRAAPPNSTLNSRLIVAGGGGGGGGTESTTSPGGAGGRAGFAVFGGDGEGGGDGLNLSSPDDIAFGGDGGAQGFGGISGGGSAAPGSLGEGGIGGAGGPDSYPGGGGGGGKFGGGGGANSADDEIGGGGGGAGSISFAPTATNTSFQRDSTGVPLVRMTYNAGGKNASGLKFGKVKRNKKRGTATLPVTVPGSGNLTVGGKGVVKKRPGFAAPWLARRVDAAGTYKLKVKAKGRKKRKLFSTGKVKVKAVVRFKPTSGDAVKTSKRIRLKKN